MAKKRVVRKSAAGKGAKSTQHSESGKEAGRGNGKKATGLAVLVIIFLVVLGVFTYFNFFSGKIAQDFQDAVSIVEQIDSSHNISFSDYENGIYYLQLNPRYPNPLNPDEMQELAGEYRSVGGGKSVRLFTEFRAGLVDAERYYRISRKTYKSDFHTYGISCKNGMYVEESINNTEKSISSINSMIGNLSELREKYPNDFDSLGISDDWINLLKGEAEDFQAEITYKKDTWQQFCGNETA